jgi:serine/threonine protein phosphatase 1
MPGRTFAIGDIHGEIDHLRTLISRLPDVGRGDTVVFLGRLRRPRPVLARGGRRGAGPRPRHWAANVVCLRGNHEDAWLRVIDEGWPGFVLPPRQRLPRHDPLVHGAPTPTRRSRGASIALFTGRFFPEETVAWFRSLPLWYEDEHAIYVHAGLVADAGRRFLGTRAYAPQPMALLWTRTESFFRDYRGKRVVVGHTHTMDLPARALHLHRR